MNRRIAKYLNIVILFISITIVRRTIVDNILNNIRAFVGER